MSFKSLVTITLLLLISIAIPICYGHQNQNQFTSSISNHIGLGRLPHEKLAIVCNISSYFGCAEFTDLYCRGRNATTNKCWLKPSQATPKDLGGHQFDIFGLNIFHHFSPTALRKIFWHYSLICQNVFDYVDRALFLLVHIGKLWLPPEDEF